MGRAINPGEVDLYVERKGEGPDVLLIAGLGDPVEAWQPQLDGLSDRYRLTAYDNRHGTLAAARRSALGGGARRRRRRCTRARAASGRPRGRILGGQRSPRSSRSGTRSLCGASRWLVPGLGSTPVRTPRSAFWRWRAEAAPSERSFLEWFYLWIYTRRGRGKSRCSCRLRRRAAARAATVPRPALTMSTGR